MNRVVKLEYFESPVVFNFEYDGYKYYSQFDYKGDFRVKDTAPEFLTHDEMYSIVAAMLAAKPVKDYAAFVALNLSYNTSSRLITKGPSNVRKFARKYYDALPPF